MAFCVIADMVSFPIRLLVGVVQIVTGLRPSEQKPDLIQWAEENESLMTGPQKVAFKAAAAQKVFRLKFDYTEKTEHPTEIHEHKDTFERKIWLIPGHEGTLRYLALAVPRAFDRI